MNTHNKTPPISVGFRYSSYGQALNPGAEYWLKAGLELVKRFPGAQPEVIWIVSIVEGESTHLTFPLERHISGTTFSREDENQAILELFDKNGIRVWLQVEPVNAEVETLFDLILERYAGHSSVIGVGVDVEWHHSCSTPEGEPLGDEESARWLAAARRHGEHYRMFVKHWKTEMLPPNNREGMLFVDDSQNFESLDQMLSEFAEWGKYFYPSPVAFQFGYPADKKWWSAYPDPLKEIGESILRVVPNTAGLFWVNFSLQELLPP